MLYLKIRISNFRCQIKFKFKLQISTDVLVRSFGSLGGRFRCLWERFGVLGVSVWGPLGVIWVLWGRPGGMRGGPGEDYGGVLKQNPVQNLGQEPSPGTSLGGSGVISGIFPEIPGGLLGLFRGHFWCFFRFFLGFVF